MVSHITHLTSYSYPRVPHLSQPLFQSILCKTALSEECLLLKHFRGMFIVETLGGNDAKHLVAMMQARGKFKTLKPSQSSSRRSIVTVI